VTTPVPETHYARTPDGVSLAYHTVGDGPVDLLWLHAFLGSLEVLWESEVMRSATEKLASFARVIRHDMRATGLSGRATALPDLETQVRDIAVVLDAVGSRSTVILGSGPGAHVAALFAATFPERTRAAVLWDLFAWTGSVLRERPRAGAALVGNGVGRGGLDGTGRAIHGRRPRVPAMAREGPPALRATRHRSGADAARDPD
jgi:pimeloyl-ACP methyl ester carboxylesterase